MNKYNRLIPIGSNIDNKCLALPFFITELIWGGVWREVKSLITSPKPSDPQVPILGFSGSLLVAIEENKGCWLGGSMSFFKISEGAKVSSSAFNFKTEREEIKGPRFELAREKKVVIWIEAKYLHYSWLVYSL